MSCRLFPVATLVRWPSAAPLNDVAMAGRRCRYMTARFILEEGFRSRSGRSSSAHGWGGSCTADLDRCQ